MRNALLILMLFFGTCFFILKLQEGTSLTLASAQAKVYSNGKWRKGEFTFRKLEDFSLEGRVLGVALYTSDLEAKLCPVDLAMGWGPMAKKENVSQVTVRQSGRWYYWHSDHLPIPQRDVEIHTANMHMIPATAELDAKLKGLWRGQMIRFSGKLVEVTMANGWHWTSSTTREDVGQGACEVIYVEKLEVLEGK